MENRTLILNKALDLFAERGYDAVGVQEVCEAAGVTKPTLYHYYGSKRGLLSALVSERAEPFRARLAEAASYRHDLPQSLLQVAEEYFRFASAEPKLYRLLLALWFVVPSSEAFQVVLAFNIAQQELIETMFSLAEADHGNMRGRHRIYAASFLGVVNTYIGMALNGFITLGQGEAQQLVKQFSHGIYS